MFNLMSEQVNELAAALAKAQGQMEAAKFDRTMQGEKYTFRYATLASVLEAVRKPLSENNLAYTQVLDVTDNGKMMLITTLIHSSGQWVSSVYPIMPLQATPQALGSAITYAKRYSLSALVGIASDEDDDGREAGQGGKASGNQRQQQPPKPPAAPKQPSAGQDGNAEDSKPVGKATIEEINRLGRSHYGDAWEVKRGEILNVLAPHAEGNALALTEFEGQKMLDGIKKKIAAAAGK